MARVHDVDMVGLDVAVRKLELHVDAAELTKRKSSWRAPAPAMTSGYQKLYIDHVLQADRGVDLDFLVGCRCNAIPRESH